MEHHRPRDMGWKRALTWILPGLVLATIAARPALADEEVYTWTDKNGVVHISTDKPPQGDAKSTKFKKTSTREQEIEQRIKDDADARSADRYLREIEIKREINAEVRREKQDQNRLKREQEEERKAILPELEIRKERYERNKREASSRSNELFWEERIKRTEREIRDSKK